MSEWLTDYGVEAVLVIVSAVVVPFVILVLNKLGIYLTDKNQWDNLDKYITEIIETIKDCVIITNQTYVEPLKALGNFTEAEQKIAFEKTMSLIMERLSLESIELLNEAYTDADKWIRGKIEVWVNLLKK